MIEMCHEYYTSGAPPFNPCCWRGLRASLRCHRANKCKGYLPSSSEYDYSKAPGRAPELKGGSKNGLETC